MQSYQPLLKASSTSDYILVRKVQVRGSQSPMSVLGSWIRIVWALVGSAGPRSSWYRFHINYCQSKANRAADNLRYLQQSKEKYLLRREFFTGNSPQRLMPVSQTQSFLLRTWRLYIKPLSAKRTSSPSLVGTAIRLLLSSNWYTLFLSYVSLIYFEQISLTNWYMSYLRYVSVIRSEQS